MINFIELTKSKLRQKLLAYFFTNPDSQLYVREIASILDEDPTNICKELNKLEKSDVFLSSTRGRQKYFSLNKKYPLYKELKSIIFKTIGVEGALKVAINKTEGIIYSFIYGSFTQDRQSSTSDIDLFVVGNPDEEKLMELIDALEKRLKREINYNIYSVKEFKEKIKKQDSFIANILKKPKITLKGSLDEI